MLNLWMFGVTVVYTAS